MRLSQSLRRVALVTTAAALLSGVPFTGVAVADPGSVSNPNPPAAQNTGGVNVTFTTDHEFTPVGDATVTFTRHGTSEEITPTADPTGSGNSMTVHLDLTRVNPGMYDITVEGTALPVVGETPPFGPDTCSSCFQVLASAPTISSPTPAAPFTIGGGASNVPFNVSGQNFTNSVYCSTAPCTNMPTIAISPSTGITLGGSGAGGAEQKANPTITKTMSVATGAATGLRDIVVTNSDGQSVTCTGCVLIHPTPTLTDVSPAARAVGAAQTNLVLTGSNFASGAAVRISLPSDAQENADGQITVGTPVVNSATQITVPVTVLSGAQTGARRVRVTNADNGSVLTSGLFTINAKPTVTGVSYLANSGTNSYGQGAQHRTLRVTGTGFQNGAVVDLAPLAGITLNSTTVNSSTQIDLEVTLAQAGSSSPPSVATHVVTVTNPDGGVSTNASNQGLTVSNGPAIDHLTPSSRGRGATSNVVITGTNFDTDGVTVSIPDVVVNLATVNSATQITANITVSSALNVAGVKSVTVMNNDDKGQYVCAACFTIDNLETDTISPSPVLNDAPKTLTIGGSGFASDATVELVKVGNGQATVTPISGTSVSVNPAGTSLTATFALAGAAPGTWSPRVTNPATNPGVGSCTCTLSVVAPAPTITGLSQSSMGAGAQNEVLTITGTGFLPGATLTFDNDGITLDSAITVTPTTITAHVSIARSAYTAPGIPPAPQETLTVTNTDGQSDAADFTVNKPPTANSTTPSSRARGSAPSTITLTGTDIVNGAAILVSGDGVTVGTATMTTGGTQVAPTQTLSASLTIASDAPLGDPRTVSVRNPDGGLHTCATCKLTITAQPTVTDVTPAKGARGTAPSVTITGTGFAPAATIDAGPGITATPTVNSPTSLTVTFTIASGAALTTRDVTVNNPDGGAATKTSAFKVFTVPGAPTGVSGTRGDSKVTVSWTAPSDDGNDALTGYTVTASPGGATASTDAAHTSVDVTGLTNGTAYTFTVHATNAAGNSAESSPSSAVTPATTPGAPTGVTATAGNTTADVSWSAPSSNGGSTITGYTVTASPGGATASVNGTTLTAHVTGLTNGTAYTFTVHATNAVGDGTESAASNSVTPATVPGAPTDVSASGGDASAHVTWTAPTDDGGSAITGYTVTSTPGGITKTAAADATSADVTGLTNGTSYTFTVHATNAKGDSAESAASNAVTPATIPGVPTSVAATGGDHSAHVTWSAPSSNGGGTITGYTVTSTPGGFTASVNGTTLAADVTGLTNGTSYTFTVHATNAKGDSAESTASNAVTPAGVPTAPTGVTATAGHGAATVSWTASSPNGSAITGYTVRSVPAGVSVTVAPNVTSTTLSGLTNGTSYTFTVTATNAKGDSAVGTSNAVVPTWVTSLTESATAKITAGGVTTVSGKLLRSNASGVSGASIRIYAKVSPATTFSLVRTVTTSSTGAYSVTFNLSRNTRFKAVYLGGTGLDPSTSAERLTSVAYRIGASYSLSGRTLTVTGAVYPNAAGRLIYLRRRNSNGTYTQLAYTRIASNGTYRMSRSLAPGTYTLYVFLSNGTSNVAGQSAYKTITIR